MGVLGSTCDVLARSWPQFGRFWEVLGSILEAFWDIGGSVKTNDSTAFWQYFLDLRGSWHVCWKMFCRVGAKTGPRSTFFAQVGDLGGHLGAKMGPDFFQKNFRSRGGPPTREEAGVAGGRGVSSGRVRVGINPTRVELLSVIYSSYTATAALGGAALD